MELIQSTMPASALSVAQKAPGLLQSPPPSSAFFPLSLLSTAESSDAWSHYENLFIACLQTGDDKSAHLCLERLTDRFGATNPRVMGLRGLYQEAVAEDEKALEKILVEYEKILDGDPMNMVGIPQPARHHPQLMLAAAHTEKASRVTSVDVKAS